MTLNSKRNVMLSMFIDAWGSTTDYALQNEQYTGDTQPPKDGSPFVYFYINYAFATIAALGTSCRRRYGQIHIVIYVPSGDSTFNSDDYANTAMSIYEGKIQSGIRFYDTSVVTEGQDELGWFVQRVTTNFEYQEII